MPIDCAGATKHTLFAAVGVFGSEGERGRGGTGDCGVACSGWCRAPPVWLGALGGVAPDGGGLDGGDGPHGGVAGGGALAASGDALCGDGRLHSGVAGDGLLAVRGDALDGGDSLG